MGARPRARDGQGCLDQSRGVLRMRPFFLFLLRARADLSFAFWPGGMKNACFFASLMISSVITFRLKRRNALSIDSPWLTVTIAILSPSSLDSIALFSTYLTRPECLWSSTKAFPLRISVCHKSQHPAGRLTYRGNPANQTGSGVPTEKPVQARSLRSQVRRRLPRALRPQPAYGPSPGFGSACRPRSC
jgi:hypothetical protein